MATNLPVQHKNVDDVAVMFRNSADELKAALGNALPVEYFLRVAVTSLRKTPLLA